MNTLIIDIRDTCLRAVLSNDGTLEYCRTFDFEPFATSEQTEAAVTAEPARKHAHAADNPYLIYYDTSEEKNPWDMALKQIIKQIRADIKNSIDSTHLIIPSDEVTLDTHQLPKMPRQDAQKLIERKISAQTKEEFPPFSILPGVSDQKTQTWCSLYVPTLTLKDYHKAFSACRLRLSSITTPINAMINAFSSVREAIFNAHAIFEIQRGFIEAFYISADGILHFQRLPYAAVSKATDSSAETMDKEQKQKIFKIINTIFSINLNYQSSYPATPVQIAWVCGLETGLDEIASALKEAMGIEVAIAPAMPTGLPDESGYVPLAGFAAALQNSSATTYAAADFFRRFPLRRTSGFIIYALTTCTALVAFTLTEREYRKLKKQVKPQDSVTKKQDNGKPSGGAAHTTQIALLKKLTSRQFVLYNLFRELATTLPDGVYIENLEYRLKEDKGVVDITALVRLDGSTFGSEPLSRFITMLDQSPTLRNHREPSVTPFEKNQEHFLKISVSSEVNPLDSTK